MSKLNEGCDRISFEISKILQDRDNMIAGYSVEKIQFRKRSVT